jgi:ABC-type Zn uptake system ZnuABC Zn-binding protein ZnuA
MSSRLLRRAWTLLAVLCTVVLVATMTPTLVLSQASGATPVPFPPTQPLPPATPPVGELVSVVTTMGLVADWSRQVGGDRIEVTSILPPNADPHDYDPAPADVAKLGDADLILTFGLGLDHWAENLIDAADSNVPSIAVGEAAPRLQPDTGADHDEVDPHVWFDPIRTISIVEEIADVLTEIDPDGTATYATRSGAYSDQLRQLDRAISDRIATIPVEHRKLVTNHDALGYYAARYGLTIVGTIIPGLDTHAEASAADIASLIELIEAENVPAIFAENTVPPDLAAEVAHQTGATFVTGLYTDSLGDDDSGVTTYLDLMRTDTEIIVMALRGE